MISTRVFVFLVMIIRKIYDYSTTVMADKQRRKPLPTEVADVYDAERYQKYFEFVADKKKLRLKYKVFDFIFEIMLIFSPFYTAIEKICNQSPYLIFSATYMIIWVISLIPDTIASYEITFGLMEKYGLNKKDKKEFVKDEILGNAFELLFTLSFSELIVFIGEHLSTWTNGFSSGYVKTVLILLAIIAALSVFGDIMKVISYIVLKKQYVFTPLEDGELKEKIFKLQEGSKKKVKKIYVYNESKKSTSKNAFLLKLFWHREFGIADNFMNENSEEELLAVLSHEIGHLKHKKDLLDYINKAVGYLLLVVVVWLMVHPETILAVNAWVRASFNLTVNNYYVLLIVLGDIIKPVMFTSDVFDAYCSRKNEYEADREAVKNGYGKELIKTFKTVSSDEFITVNPHPFIEFTEYDHPGMYQRIRAIHEAEVAMES